MPFIFAEVSAEGNPDPEITVVAPVCFIGPGCPAVGEGLFKMIAFRIDKSQRRAARRNRDVFPFLEELDISAGDHKAGVIIADQVPFAGQEISPYFAAFNPGVTGAVQAAETGDAVSLAVDPDYGIPADDLRFSVESAEDGARVAADGRVDTAAANEDFRGSAHGTDGGGAFTGGEKAEISGHADFRGT